MWGVRHERTQFVENRVSTIWSLVSPQHWRHCVRLDNLADIHVPSWGMSILTLNNTPLWLKGPGWLCSGDWHTEDGSKLDTSQVTAPDDCLQGIKHSRDPTHDHSDDMDKAVDELRRLQFLQPLNQGHSSNLKIHPSPSLTSNYQIQVIQTTLSMCCTTSTLDNAALQGKLVFSLEICY